MKLLAALLSQFTGGNTEPVDLELPPAVTVQREARPKNVGTTTEDARRRHGKPFKAHAKVERITPPSRDLEFLNQKSEESAPRIVANIRRQK